MSLVVHRAKIGFVSGRGGLKHLKAHLSYVSRKSALIFTYNATAQSFNDLFVYAQERLLKRKDARIGLRMFLALPYLWYVIGKDHSSYLELKAKELRKFLAEVLQMKEQDLMLFFHRPGDDGKNFHVHVVGLPRRKDGRPLKLSPSEIYDFHKRLDTFFAEQGFEVFRLKDHGFSENQVRQIQLPIGVYKKEDVTPIKTLRKVVRTHAEQELGTRTGLTRQHLSALYSPDDTVWIVLKRHQDSKPEHYKKKVKEIDDRFLTWLRHMNAQGYDVYISLNVLREDSTNGEKEQIKPLQDKIWIDLDSERLKTDARVVLERILKETGLPEPTVVLITDQTSYGNNLQVVWKFTQKVEFQKLEEVMKELERRYGMDATHDGARVFRLAGFKNCSLIEVNTAYDLGVLETLRQRLFHENASQRLAEKESVKKETETTNQTTQKTPTQTTQTTQTTKPTQQTAQTTQTHRPTQQPKQQTTQTDGPTQTTQITQPAQTTQTPKPTQQTPQTRLSYRELLQLYARKELNISIDLSNTGPDKSEEEYDYAFCRELLLHFYHQRLPAKQALELTEKALNHFLSKVRPEKLQRNKDYPKQTTKKAFESIRAQLHVDALLNFLAKHRYSLDPPRISKPDLFEIHTTILRQLTEQVNHDEAYEVFMQFLSEIYKNKDHKTLSEYADKVFTHIEKEKYKFIDFCEDILREKGYDVVLLSSLSSQSYREIYKSIALELLRYNDVDLPQAFKELTELIKARTKDQAKAQEQAKQALEEAVSILRQEPQDPDDNKSNQNRGHGRRR